MATRIFIDGAAGTTGLEIRERLTGRSEFELIVLDDAQRKSEAARRDALHAADVAILCLPDDAAREAVRLAEGSDTRFIDASTAHRVADGWTYGFPELVGRDKIAGAQFVSNPGCYPTGFLALVAPLVRAGLLPADWPYTINAVSGYSGGGKALIERFESDLTIGFRAYGLSLDHKHLAEMQKYAGLAHAPVFSPSVVPTHRGMVVDVPLPLSAMNALQSRDAATAIQSCWYETYQDSAIVMIADAPESGEILLSRNAQPWDGMHICAFVNADGLQARLIAKLDNLGKGASGAAIQSLNIMCGFPEETGLAL
ncbi:N-acetyl-gamma-glutamyl-phosphate reductase [Altererythrobacter lutimaris]|uniref:N-acetyl-gamma-glutamyl-phosphate reductase n=1 Tax=Altererythrobacter lutimaris TaxID=2743979 RepID=A0A850HDC1_9SPHN|nr:N-acetyl-gamma-glutamyl-phosphate reductase [Altererythrobacter lutimaris]NVE94718.1 N-acetyl-gamma-glutamyl-phosphate reductase [Altererythrobacter lutimaris]